MQLNTIEDLENSKPEELSFFIDALMDVAGEFEDFLAWRAAHPLYEMQVNVSLGGHRASDVFHPSALGQVCDLAVYYGRIGAKEVPGESTDTVTFDFGHLIHKWVQDQLGVIFGESFLPEAPLRIDSPPVRGHADGLFTFPNMRALLEVKTIKEGDGPYHFGTALKGPLPGHKVQTSVYMKASDVPLTLYMYFCKNNSERAVHVATFDKKIWLEAHRRMTRLEEMVETDEMPGHKKTFFCTFCNYRGICPHVKEARSATKKATSRIRVRR